MDMCVILQMYSAFWKCKTGEEAYGGNTYTYRSNVLCNNMQRYKCELQNIEYCYIFTDIQ